MSSSNLPRHGDAIIEQKEGALGRRSLVARPQFQQFLDELGTLLDNPDIDLSDITQIISSANYGSRIASLGSKVNKLKDSEQVTFINDALISRLRADNATLRRTIAINDQEINVLRSAVTSTQSAVKELRRRINDLEQSINVN